MKNKRQLIFRIAALAIILVIAACILYLLPELLRGLSTYRMLIYSIVLIVMMIYTWSPKVIDWRKRTFGARKLPGMKA